MITMNYALLADRKDTVTYIDFGLNLNVLYLPH